MAAAARLRPTVAAGALALAATLPISRLFQGGVLPEALIAISGALAIAWVSRRWRLPPFVDLLFTFAALAELVALSYLRSTLALGIIPTGATVRGFTELIDAGVSRIQAEVAPVVSGPEVLVFITIGAWLTAWLIDTAARTLSNPMLAIVAGIPLLAMPGTLLVSDKLWLAVGPYVLASLFVMWSCEHPEPRPVGASFKRVATAGIAAAIIALVAVPMLPGFAERPLLKELGDSAIVFNPISALQPTLSDRRVRQLFLVRTTRSGYYRLTTLDSFDGNAFSQSSDSRSTRLDASDQALLPDAPTLLARENVRQEFRLTRLAGNWMPVQAEVARVIPGQSVAARYEPDSGAVVVLPSLPQRLSYVAESSVPIPTAEGLAALPATTNISLPDASRYLGLPTISPNLRTISRQIVGDADTPYLKAVAIQRHLRRFTYDLEVARSHDIRTLEEFLTTVKAGYCEQFATAMAVLARIEGIPSRVVVGFGPGTVRTTVGTGTEYQVTTLDAHAWPEIWLEGAGWVAFEPTPRAGFGIVPAYTLGPSAGGSSTGGQPTDEPTTSPTGEPSEQPSAQPSASQPASEPTGAPGRIPGIALRVLAIAAATGVAWFGLRSGWRRLLRAPMGGLPAGYRLFMAACDRVGIGRRRAETVREHAARIAKLPGIDPQPIQGLAAATEASLYGTADGLELLKEGQAARDAVLMVIPAHRRLLAKVRANVGAVTGV